MKRGLLTYILIIAAFISVSGTEVPKITFGAEWGYMPSLFSGHHYNFFDPDGFRMDDKDTSFGYFTNGEVTLHAGYNFNECWNLSFHTGYSGAGGFAPVVPMSLRITRYWGDDHISDRWLTFAECGSGISIKKRPANDNSQVNLGPLVLIGSLVICTRISCPVCKASLMLPSFFFSGIIDALAMGKLFLRSLVICFRYF